MSYQLENSDQVLVGVHSSRACLGWYCTIHRKSDHHMRSWPQNWRPDMFMMERICPHGVGHWDPDEIWAKRSKHPHSCDGCCSVPVEPL